METVIRAEATRSIGAAKKKLRGNDRNRKGEELPCAIERRKKNKKSKKGTIGGQITQTSFRKFAREKQ